MTTIESTPGYKQLALDSSNDMIRYDSLWVQGDYSEAAWHVRRAGFARQQMGQIQFETGEFADAAEDWLSAAECFYLATELKKMQDCIERVQRLRNNGQIPAPRSDILETLAEREDQAPLLNKGIEDFLRGFHSIAGPELTASQAALDYLSKSVARLPGLSKLHYAIYRQSLQLGSSALAVEHLKWAYRFEPENSNYAAFYGYQLISEGDHKGAIELGCEVIKRQHAAPQVRLMLSQALATITNGTVPNLDEAIQILKPLVEEESAEALNRLRAIGLSLTFLYELERDAEARQLLHMFDLLAGAIQATDQRVIVAQLRKVLPNPGMDAIASSSSGGRALSEPNRSELFRGLFPKWDHAAAA